MKNVLLTTIEKFFFKQIDNTGLVLFRAIFGLLITLEAFGAIITGWVRRVLVEPNFTFNFIGFDFLQHLQGNTMYVYFVLMGIFGVMVMLGYKYRFAMFLYALMWSFAYFMQKTSYNNHYYFMILLCWIMAFLPANKAFSLDAKYHPEIKTSAMPQWSKWLMILQIFIVFTYGSVAKWYPDWVNLTVPELFMNSKKDYWLIGNFLQQRWVHFCIAYFGIFFDLLIIPMLLWKKTRLLGFYLSLFFHLFNSIVFQVGIFPYMSIAFALFFFSSETLQKRFLKTKEIYTKSEIIVPKYKNIVIGIFFVYFIIQISLPLRHFYFTDDVLWTEEGHRLSWRMMLRSKSGRLTVYTLDKETGKKQRYQYQKILSKKQIRSVKTKPDLLWQLAQKIKTLKKQEGKNVAVFMDSKVSVNGGPYFKFIDPQVDLASQEWNPFCHSNWILPSPKDYHKK
ncbi:MAG: HTTM domain-containing protein [Flavobacteriales bacterium]